MHTNAKVEPMDRRLPTESDLQELRVEFEGMVQFDVPLDELSRWRIGGPADAFMRPPSVPQLQRIRAWLNERELAHVVIGATSNLLFADDGLRAIAIQLAGKDFCALSVDRHEMLAGAAAWVPGIARTAMKAGLSGLEHTCGIPSTLGGLIYMNGGSKRLAIGDHTLSVVSVDPTGKLVKRNRADCGFKYRTSVFQGLNDIIVEVHLGPFEERPADEVRREMLQILRDRSRKFPRKLPNCGSVFLSHPDMYAEHGPPGMVLERLGFKGRQVGRAQFSPVHANFINNLGGASANDVLTLIRQAKQAVSDATGHDLAVEARYVDQFGEITSAG